MSKDFLIRGLRSAVGKGEPLKKAMMTFYNAGYNKTEIEQAAKAVMHSQTQMNTKTASTKKSSKQKPKKQGFFKKICKKEQKSQIPKTNTAPAPKPQVSSYGIPKKPKSFLKTIMIILVIIFILLLIVLGVLAFFGEQILTTLFG